jgi:hypothetical protein
MRSLLKRIVIPVLVVLVAGSIGLIVWRNWPQAQTGKVPDTLPTGWVKRSSWVNPSFVVVPIGQGEAGKPRPLDEVWPEVIPGMTKDPATRALIGKLCGGVDVELAMVAAADIYTAIEASPEKPPNDRCVIFYGIQAPQPGKKVWLEQGTESSNPCPEPTAKQQATGRFVMCLEVNLGLTFCSRQKVEDEYSAEVLRLLINDYLLRQQLGCFVYHGPANGSPFKEVKGGGGKVRIFWKDKEDPAVLRAGVDAAIEKYLKSK